MFYPEDYYSFSPRWSSVRAEGGWRRGLLNSLVEGVLEQRYGYARNKDRHVFLADSIIPLYRFAAPVFPRFVQGGRVVDVGTGCGEYLLHLAELGWDAHGVEICDAAAAIGRKEKGLDIRSGELSDAGFPGNYFDAVTMHHTLEHVRDPKATLLEVNRILGKGGELVISGPNALNWERRLFGRCWWGWDVPRHLWHFTPDTLGRLLDQCGFSVTGIVYQADTYELPRNIVNLLDTFLPGHWSFFEKFLGAARLRFLTKFPMSGFALLWSLLGISEKFAVFARKKGVRNEIQSESVGAD